MNWSTLQALVVEDHHFQRSLTVEALRSLGIAQVLDTANGRSALTLLRRMSRPPDVVVCDLDVPGMDGVELIRHIGEQHLARSVIICSKANPMVQQMVETMADGYGVWVLGQIGKPVNAPTLRELLEALERPPEMISAATSATPTAEDVRLAFERGEFIPAYQPKVLMPSGQVVGAELLARWDSPTHGLLLPASFIPTLIAQNLLGELTERFLTTACRQRLVWQREGIELELSVNVSSSLLSNPRTADRYATLVRESGCEPNQLTLEITETEALNCDANVLNVLARLWIAGFGLSIDDFGAGYSNLQHLSRIAYTELKIDRAFVRRSNQDQRLQSFVVSAIELGRRLNLTIVAEGIESPEEWDLLARLGCHQAQGYFIARPLSSPDFTRWATRWGQEVSAGKRIGTG